MALAIFGPWRQLFHVEENENHRRQQGEGERLIIKKKEWSERSNEECYNRNLNPSMLDAWIS